MRPSFLTLCFLLAAIVAAVPRSAGAFIIYSWNAAVSGSADDPNRWNPFGVPAWDDYMHFNQSGTYTVTFPGTVPTSSMIGQVAGDVTFNVNSPHTTQELLLGGAAGNLALTVAYGLVNTNYLNLGQPGSVSNLTLTGASLTGSATLHSWSMGNHYYNGSGGDIIGYGGIANMDVFGGARYLCERTQQGSWPLQLGKEAGAVGNLSVAGRNAALFQRSAVLVSGSEVGEGMIVGVAGVSNVFAYNGGYIDVAGNMQLAQLNGSSGYVTIGPSGISGSASLNVHNELWVGHNFYGTVLAGHGELTVRSGAWVTVGDRCEVGDPDNDAGSLLRVAQGGTFRANGGLRVWPTSGPGLDLRGGMTHVRGDAFAWPAGKFLVVSSQVGTPELRIDNGIANTGPATPAFNSQLFVGRAGNGTLRIAQPGTVFAMGLGSTTLGDSLGGVGTIVADSSATIASGGPVYVGVRGNGFLDVQHGATVDVGAMGIALDLTSLGEVTVSGAGSLLQARDNLWIGGGPFGQGSTASVDVDSGAVVNVLHTGGVNPALTTIYEYGTLGLANGGRLVTPGNVQNWNGIYLTDGELEAMSVNNTPAANVNGAGRLIANLQSSGRVSPSAYSSSFGRIDVDGNFVQYPAGHYWVNLGTAAGLQCDSLVVSGTATLDGTLDLFPEGGFAPNPGDAFTVMTFASRTGQFAAVNWGGAPLAGQANVVYGPTWVRVVIPGAPTGVGPGPGAVAELRFAPAGGAGTSLAFTLELPEAAEVDAKVYDIRGREVATLQAGSLGAGPHRLTPGATGRDLPSGAYFARAVISAGGTTVVRSARITLVR